MVASTGGHLAQLHRMAETLGASKDSVWVTFKTPQSVSLLAGQRVHYVPYVAPRAIRSAWTAHRSINGLLKRERFDGIVSTGAAIAVSAMSCPASRSVPRLYIESVSRTDGPSLSGRILAATRLAELRTQHKAWASRKWTYAGNVLDEFDTFEADAASSPSLFVTLGTIRPYRFDRVIDAVLASGLPDERTVWQLGTTGRSDLPGRVLEQMSATDFARAARNASIVVTHAGVGTILQLLDMGVYPVVVPRRKKFGEHVDDHQLQIASLLADRGIASVADPEELRRETMLAAAARGVRAR